MFFASQISFDGTYGDLETGFVFNVAFHNTLLQGNRWFWMGSMFASQKPKETILRFLNLLVDILPALKACKVHLIVDDEHNYKDNLMPTGVDWCVSVCYNHLKRVSE